MLMFAANRFGDAVLAQIGCLLEWNRQAACEQVNAAKPLDSSPAAEPDMAPATAMAG